MRPGLSPFQHVARLGRHPARPSVQRRVRKFDPVQTDVDEQPAAHGPQGARRNAPSPRLRQHPLRDFARTLGQVQGAQAHAGE